jgi:hypothetical protein
VDFTVKVTTPEALDTAEAGVMVSPPRLEESVTVLPGTTLVKASLRVTVTVEVPFAVVEVGEATTVESVALTAAGL